MKSDQQLATYLKYRKPSLGENLLWLPRLVTIVLLGALVDRGAAQESCFSGGMLPKTFSASGVDEHVYSVAHSETLNAVFTGGRADNDGAYSAVVMRVDLDTTMTKWRRIYEDKTSAGMDVVTAMAVAPDHQTIACLASVQDPTWSVFTFIFTVRASDGGHNGDTLNIRSGATNKGEHIVFDQGVVYHSASELYLTSRQVSPTMRGKGQNDDYAGALTVARVDPSTSTLTWKKEQESFGFSSALVYKDFGDGTADLIVGGALDQVGSASVKEWRLGIAFINDDGTFDSGDNTFYITQEEVSGDISSFAPYIDHMYLEEVSVPGANWLFGTTRSLDLAQSGDQVYLWKLELDAVLNKPTPTSGLVCTKVQTGGIASSGYVVAVRPTWVSGSMHYIWLDGDGSLYYSVYDWVSTTSTSIKLYDNLIQVQSAIFTAGAPITDQGLQIQPGFLGASMRVITTPSGDFSRLYDTALVLPFHAASKSCLTDVTGTKTLVHESTPNTLNAGSVDWKDYLIPGYGTSLSILITLDVPVTTIEDDSWCSVPDAAITSITPGSAGGSFCFSWDETYYSIPFTPPTAIATLECNDPAPTWMYSIDQTRFNSDIVKVSVDPGSNTIWLKPMLAGAGRNLSQDLTVTARLPTGETTSFTFHIGVFDPLCAGDVVPSVLVDQSYNFEAVLAGYDAPDFTYSDPNCLQQLSYENTISTNTFITGITDNLGVGKLVEWYTNNPLDLGQYTVTITGSVACSVGYASYVLDVVLDCSDLVITPPAQLQDQQYIITDTAQAYQFEAFTVAPSLCFLDYTYSVTDPAGAAAVLSLDSASRTFMFYYDADIPLSGGTAVEFLEYTVTVSGSRTDAPALPEEASFKLQLRNPCFYPEFIQIDTAPLPIGPHSYTLYQNQLDDPLQIITHSAWTYSTNPTTHTFCGDLTYTATYEGAVADETSVPNMAYYSQNRTFAIYSEDLALIGMTTVTVSAFLTDYPMIVSAVPETAQIEIIDPCLDPQSVTATAQTDPAGYRYTGSNPSSSFTLTAFEVYPPICPITYSCSMQPTSPVTDLCSVTGVFDPQTGDFTFETNDIAAYPPGDYIFEITGTSATKSAVGTWTLTLVDPCPDTVLTFPNQNPIADSEYILREPQLDIIWSQVDLFSFTSDVDCGPQTVTFHNADGSAFDTGLFSDYQGSPSNAFQVLPTQDTGAAGIYPISYTVHFDNYPVVVGTQTQPFEITITDPCDSPVSISLSTPLTDQEYTISQANFDYVIPQFTADPAWCDITYSYTVSDASGSAAISFDPTSRTFNFFNLDNLNLSGPVETEYTVEVTATTGNVDQKQNVADFTLKIKNPCIDPVYSQITPVPLPDTETYILYTFDPITRFSFTHDPFTHSMSICGDLAYTATFGATTIDLASSPMGYDSDSRAFSIYSTDVGLIGMQDFTIEAYLADYNSITSSTETAQIEIIDPCLDPFSVTATDQTDPAGYRYTGNTPSSSFALTAFDVDPPICPIIYSCSMLPASPVTDLCSVVGVFDPQTGDFTFETNDIAAYPPGDYIFEITGTSATKSAVGTWTLTLVDPCPDTVLTFPNQNPIADSEYILRDPQLDIIWVQTDLYSFTSDVDCGPQTVTFHNADGSAFDTVLFADYQGTPSNAFQVMQTQDTGAAGTYPISYTVQFDNYPVVVGTQTKPFEITIIDPCDNPVSVILSTTLTDQEYTISQANFDYVIPQFTADPAWCDITYSYTDSDVSGSAAISFDPTSRTFNFFNLDDLSLSGPVETEYTVEVTAVTGNVDQKQNVADFILKIKNPCINPVYSQITPVPLPDTETYILYTFDPISRFSFTHDPFAHSMSICGDLAYTATFDGVVISSASSPMGYDSNSRTFSIYSTDVSLIGMQDFAIEAYLFDYNSITSPAETAQIEIIDPCLDPFSITVPAQTSPADYYYTGSSPQLSFAPDTAIITDPPICDVVYSCTTLAPAQDLCALNDGTSQSFFDISSGALTLSTSDMASYPAGTYQIEVTATSATKSGVFTIDVTLVDPCPTVDLNLQPTPFQDTVYILEDPAVSQAWLAANMIDPFTDVDCGPISVEFFDQVRGTIDASLFQDDRSADPINEFRTLFNSDFSLKGSYTMSYQVYHTLYPANVEVQPDTFTITVVNACDDPVSLQEMPLTDQTYTLTDTVSTYAVPLFIAEPTNCDIIYSFEVTDPAGSGAFTFDADPSAPTFTFYKDDDLTLAGASSIDYLVTLKAQLGSSNTIEKQSTFTLTLKNPCVDPDFVSINKLPLPTGIQYELFDNSPTAGYQFTHDPFTITTLPISHTLCGPIDHLVLFMGAQINPPVAGKPSPIEYDSLSNTFELYSEDFGLIGTQPIEIQGFLHDHPSMVSTAPNEVTSIDIIDPCESPDQITSSTQNDAVTYRFTPEAMLVTVNPPVVVPYICAVTYECITIIGADPDVKCDDPVSVTFDSSTGSYSFQSFDVARYSSGTYELVVRATTGTVSPITTDITLEFVLENPCPTVELANSQPVPFFDMNYVLGGESIAQGPFSVTDYVTLDTQADCGPIQFEFVDQNGDPLDRRLFSQETSDDGATFVVLQQSLFESVGEHVINYRMSLVEYPDVSKTSDKPFIVTITGPEVASDFKFMAMPPKWLTNLQNQVIYVGEHLQYVLDVEANQFDKQPNLKVDLDWASKFAYFDNDLNQFVVQGEKVSDSDVGDWQIRVTAEYSYELSQKSQSFENAFTLTILADPNIEEAVEEEVVIDPSKTVRGYPGTVILKPQEYHPKRPKPYIVSFTPNGVLTIGWDQPMMQADNPEVIPDTRVAVLFELYDFEKQAIESEVEAYRGSQRRDLRKAIREEDWFNDQMRQKELHVMILDALEVKMVQQDDSQDAKTQAQDFQWDISSYDENQIELLVKFDNPDGVGSFASKDEIMITFWQTDLFKSQLGISVELGYTLKQRLVRIIKEEDAESVNKVEGVLDAMIVTTLVPFALFLGVGGRLLPTWMFLNSMQLIVHLPLLPSSMPANLHEFLTHYLSYVRINSQNLEDILKSSDSGSEQAEYETNLESSNSLTQTVLLMSGYSHQFQHNLIAVLFIALVLMLAFVVANAVDCFSHRQRRVKHRSGCTAWICNFSIRFVYEFFLEVLICVLVHLSTQEPGNQLLASVLHILTILIFIVLAALTVFVVGLCFRGGPSMKTSAAKVHTTVPDDDHKMIVKHGETLGTETARELLELKDCQPIAINEVRHESYEGGQMLYSTKKASLVDSKRLQARSRIDQQDQASVSHWYKTLFYGLRQNHSFKVAVLHPLAFLLRRILYATVIVFSREDNIFWGALAMLLTCLFMMGLVWSQAPWQDSYINSQHFVNEAVFYMLCLATMCFSGLITEPEQSKTFGWILIGLITCLTIYNLYCILYDLVKYLQLLYRRYRMLLPFRLRAKSSRVLQRRGSLPNLKKVCGEANGASLSAVKDKKQEDLFGPCEEPVQIWQLDDQRHDLEFADLELQRIEIDQNKELNFKQGQAQTGQNASLIKQFGNRDSDTKLLVPITLDSGKQPFAIGSARKAVEYLSSQNNTPVLKQEQSATKNALSPCQAPQEVPDQENQVSLQVAFNQHMAKLSTPVAAPLTETVSAANIVDYESLARFKSADVNSQVNEQQRQPDSVIQVNCDEKPQSETSEAVVMKISPGRSSHSKSKNEADRSIDGDLVNLNLRRELNNFVETEGEDKCKIVEQDAEAPEAYMSCPSELTYGQQHPKDDVPEYSQYLEIQDPRADRAGPYKGKGSVTDLSTPVFQKDKESELFSSRNGSSEKKVSFAESYDNPENQYQTNNLPKGRNKSTTPSKLQPARGRQIKKRSSDSEESVKKVWKSSRQTNALISRSNSVQALQLRSRQVSSQTPTKMLQRAQSLARGNGTSLSAKKLFQCDNSPVPNTGTLAQVQDTLTRQVEDFSQALGRYSLPNEGNYGSGRNLIKPKTDSAKWPGGPERQIGLTTRADGSNSLGKKHSIQSQRQLLHGHTQLNANQINIKVNQWAKASSQGSKSISRSNSQVSLRMTGHQIATKSGRNSSLQSYEERGYEGGGTKKVSGRKIQKRKKVGKVKGYFEPDPLPNQAEGMS